MLCVGVIELVDCLDWVFLLVFVNKVDGMLCICVDYKFILNFVLLVDCYLFFRIDDVLVGLNGV